MFKTADFVEEFQTISKGEMTPIVEDSSAHFAYKNPYSDTLWRTKSQNKQVVNNITLKSNLARERTLKRSFADKATTENNLISAQCMSPLTDVSFDTPLSKKIDSPLRLHSFYDYMSSYTPKSSANRLRYVNSIREIVESKTEYVEKLKKITDVFYFEFKNNKIFKRRLGNIIDDGDGEMLLFGNIFTMIDLCNMMIKDIKDQMSVFFKVDVEDEHFWLNIETNVNFVDLDGLNITKILQQSYIKSKQVNQSYAMTHERQKAYLSFLKKSKHTKIYISRWIDACNCDYDLEHLIALPITEIYTTMDLLNGLVLNSNALLSAARITELSVFQKEYAEFIKEIKSTMFLSVNGKKDWSMNDTHDLLHHDGDSTKTNTKLDHILSNSSSMYSSNEVREGESDQSCTVLCEKIIQFDTIFKGAKRLKKLLINLDLTKFVQSLKGNGLAWCRFMQADISDNSYCNENTACSNIPAPNSMYSKYMEKLEAQLLEVDKYQKSVLSHSLIKQLSQMLVYCSKVQKAIDDFSQLKKEQTRHTHGSVTHIAIMKQYDFLQLSLIQQLPDFIQYCSEFVDSFLLNYVKMLSEYLIIMSGGQYFVGRETDLSKNTDRDVGDNFDILQKYSSSRFVIKKAVKENWFEESNYIYSKMYRKFFE